MPVARPGASRWVALGLPLLLLAAGVAASLWPLWVFLALLLGGAVVYVAWLLPTLPIREAFLPLRWWQVLWFLTLISGWVFRQRTVTEASDNPLDSAALFRVACMGLVALGVHSIAVSRKVEIITPMFKGVFLLLTLFNLLCLASYIWSVNPAWTLYRSIEHTVDIILVATMVATFTGVSDYRRLMNWTWVLIGLELSTLLIGVVLAPHKAIVPGFGLLGFEILGVYPVFSRNGIGDSGSLIAAVALARLATSSGNKRLFWGLLMLGLGIMFISQTRSAIAAFVLVLPLVLLVTRRLSWIAGVVLLAFAAITITNIGGTFDQYWSRNESAGQISTLSGRTEFWQIAWDQAQEQPWTGYGAFAGGRFVVAEQTGYATLSSTHGTLPQVLVDTGFPGVALVLAAVVAVWWYVGRAAMWGRRDTEEERATWALSVEAMAVMTIITVRAFFDIAVIWHPAMSFLAVVAYAEYLRRSAATARRAAQPDAGPVFKTAEPAVDGLL